MAYLCCLLLLAVLRVAWQQQDTSIRPSIGSCPSFDASTLGRTDMLSTEGFVPAALNPGGDVPVNERTERVRINRTSLVCTSPGITRGTFSSVSYIVLYDVCDVSATCDGSVPGAVRIVTRQFQFDCFDADPDSWLNNNGQPFKQFSERATPVDDPMGDLTTQLSTQCAECSVSQETLVTDPNTHCRACPSVCTGQGLCLGESFSDPSSDAFCCNYYYNDRCVVSCPSSLSADASTGFNCGCGILSVPAGASVAYSNPNFLEGSTATLRCNAVAGYVLSSGSTEPTVKTCSLTGWSSGDIECERFTCATADLATSQFGTVSLNPASESNGDNLIGAVANFSCNEGFARVGDETRTCTLPTGWSGTSPTCESTTVPSTVATVPMATSDTGSSTCGTGCIVGIVLAVLGAIIVAAVLAGVAYAVYSYMNNPDTKIAKYDPAGINGVAKDNPLYVDPETVVGDGAEAA